MDAAGIVSEFEKFPKVIEEPGAKMSTYLPYPLDSIMSLMEASSDPTKRNRLSLEMSSTFCPMKINLKITCVSSRANH
jgi:hypothetical protein